MTQVTIREAQSVIAGSWQEGGHAFRYQMEAQETGGAARTQKPGTIRDVGRGSRERRDYWGSSSDEGVAKFIPWH